MPGYTDLMDSVSAPQGQTGSGGYAGLMSQYEVPTEEYVQRSHAAGLATGRSPDEQAAILRKKGLPEGAVNSLVQNYKLDQATQNLGRFEGGKETIAGSIAKQAKEHFIPFRSWFVDNQKDEADAQARFQQGQATDKDIQTLALARRRREDEAKLHETIVGEVISAARDAPAIMGEYMAGSELLKATGALQAERVSRLGNLLSGAGRTAVVTAAMPSMYMEAARQKNIENGRDPSDWRGLPPAGLHAFAQMVVLGRVFKSAGEPAAGLIAGARAAAGAGIKGAAEMALADSVTHLADLVVPDAYKISTGEGTFEKLLKGNVSGAARKFGVDSLTLAMFAGMHRMADGLSPPEAAEKAKEALDVVKDLPPAEVSRLKEWVRSSTDPETPQKLFDYFDRLKKFGPSLEPPRPPEAPTEPPPEAPPPAPPEAPETPPEARAPEPATEPAKPTAAAPEGTGEAGKPVAPKPEQTPAQKAEMERLLAESAKEEAEQEMRRQEGARGRARGPGGRAAFQIEKRPPGAGEGTPDIHPFMTDLLKNSGLAPQQQKLLVARMKGVTLDAIGKKAGITREAVRKREGVALEQFRRSLEPLYEKLGLDPAEAEKLSMHELNRRLVASDLLSRAEGGGVARSIARPEAGELNFLRATSDAIRTDPALSDAQRAEYAEAVGRVFDSLPQAALDAVGKNMRGAKFYATPQEAAIGQARGMLARTDLSPQRRARIERDLNRWLAGGRVDAVGGFDGATMHIDGSAGRVAMGGRYGGTAELSSHQIAAHESGHAIDGPDNAHSRSSAWQFAWGKDIQGRGMTEKPLTNYAAEMASEGFAEFARLLYASEVPTERIARDFPEASKYFKKRGLWPEERGGTESGINELFNRRLGDDKSAAHMDVGEDAGFLRVPTAEDFGRLKDYLWRGGEWLKWAAGGKSGTPPGVTLDMSKPLPRPQEWQAYKDIAAEQQGIGRIPILRWLFDPGRSDTTAEGKVFVAHQALRETSEDVAALWAVQERVADQLFGADAEGKYTRGDKTKGYMADDIEAEMRGEKTALSPEQKAWVKDVWTPLLRDAQAMMREEGIKNYVDADGNPLTTTAKAYFPRTSVGRRNMPDLPVGGGDGRPGAKAAHEKARRYDSEAEGSKDVIYDPSAKSRVAKFISEVYRTVADKRLADDPALKGETPTARFEALKAANKGILDALDEAGKADLLAELKERADTPSWTKGETFVRAGPAFQGKIYPADIAAKIEGMFKQESSDWLRKVEKFSSAAKGIALGGDASFAFIQLLPTLFRAPAKWATAMKEATLSLFDKNRLAKYLDTPENAAAARELTQVGSSVGRLQDFMTGLATGGLATKIPVLGPLYEATGRAFGTALDVAKIELWKAWKPTAQPAEYRALAEAIDSMLLSGRMESIGLSPRRAMAERLMMLAPSYYRGGLNLIATAFQRGVPGDLARQALGATAAGILISSVAAMKAVGLSDDEVEERLNPARGKFLKVPVDLGDNSKLEVGYGNILTSYVRLAGAAAEQFGTDRPIDTGADGNPVLRWLRGKAATSPRLMIDLWTGKDYFGKRQEPQEALLRAFEPLAAQQVLHGDKGVFEKGVGEAQAPAVTSLADAAVSLFGLTSFAGSDADARRAVYDDEARKQHGQSFAELTLTQQAGVVKAAGRRPDMPSSKPPTADDMERAFLVRAQRAKALANALSDDNRQKLTDLNEDLPAPAATVRVNGADVPLGNARMRQYEALLGQEYDTVISRWDVSNIKGMNAEARKKWVDNQLRQAGERARRKLMSQ